MPPRAQPEKLQNGLDRSFVVVKGVSETSHLSVKMPRVTKKSPQPERRTNQGKFRDRFRQESDMKLGGSVQFEPGP